MRNYLYLPAISKIYCLSLFVYLTKRGYITFIPNSVSLWNDLVDPVFDGVGLKGCKSSTNALSLTYKDARSIFYLLQH